MLDVVQHVTGVKESQISHLCVGYKHAKKVMLTMLNGGGGLMGQGLLAKINSKICSSKLTGTLVEVWPLRLSELNAVYQGLWKVLWADRPNQG